MMLVIILLITNNCVFAQASEQPGSFSITSPGDGSSVTGDFSVNWSTSENAVYSIESLQTCIG